LRSTTFADAAATTTAAAADNNNNISRILDHDSDGYEEFFLLGYNAL
jgi:hypothetical protein